MQGTVTLAGSLTGTTGYTPGGSDKLFIIANDGVDSVNGTFFGVPQGGTVILGSTTWTVYYNADFGTQNANPGTGNDVVLVIPEPATIAGVLCLGLPAILRRRRR